MERMTLIRLNLITKNCQHMTMSLCKWMHCTCYMRHYEFWLIPHHIPQSHQFCYQHKTLATHIITWFGLLNPNPITPTQFTYTLMIAKMTVPYNCAPHHCNVVCLKDVIPMTVGTVIKCCKPKLSCNPSSMTG